MYKTLLSIPGRSLKISVVSNASTGGPSSREERGRDSCLRAVLSGGVVGYKRLFTKACMGL